MDNPIKSADLFGTDIWNIDVGSGNVVQKINYIGKDIINLVYNVSEVCMKQEYRLLWGKSFL